MRNASDIVKCYKTPEVRDLAWAILSPPLVQIKGKVDWASADWYRCAYHNVEEQLQALDNQPDPLLELIAQRNASRLGFYFEALLEMWCQLEPAIELIATNPQINRADGSTQGAFDFIVKVNGEVEHWECAIKFYLGQPPAGDEHTSLWHGPNRKDRLDLKLGHMQTTQLRLSGTAQGKAWLDAAGLDVQRVRSIVKGRVFYPNGLPISPPENATEEHNRGTWIEASSFEETRRQQGRWIHLPRLNWLAPRSEQELENQSEVSAITKPALLSRCENGWEVERIFAVPDGWGNAGSE